ncbi:dihydrofolate reductase family protein [Actinophytocola sp.]|uniref:dihydrofolate reductase family protein n=1 Tax=Actinophytocola sp. TaxID=1872138 RepID=UPI003D6B7541
MILGANTYAQAKDYWPYADDQGEYGEKLNNLTKFVASSKLDAVPRGRLSRRDRDARPGRHHPQAQGAERQGHLAVGKLETHALPVGRGRRRRDHPARLPSVTRRRNTHFKDRQDLNPVEATSFENGVVRLRYEIMK